MRYVKRLLAISMAMPIIASAQERMPDLSSVTTGAQAAGVWYTDRYAPASFVSVPTFQGRNGVLQIGISANDASANRPAGFGAGFYNTQGRKYDINANGPFYLSADLWVDQSWANPANGLRRTDMWGVGYDASNAVSFYSIIGFTNDGGGRLRGWDGVGAWIDFAAPVNYGQWNALQIQFDGSNISYFVNGALQTSFADPGSTTRLGEVIMQGFNFDANDARTADYTASWSNTQVVPEPSTYALMAAGLAGIVAVQRRRRRNA